MSEPALTTDASNHLVTLASGALAAASAVSAVGCGGGGSSGGGGGGGGASMDAGSAGGGAASRARSTIVARVLTREVLWTSLFAALFIVAFQVKAHTQPRISVPYCSLPM